MRTFSSERDGETYTMSFQFLDKKASDFCGVKLRRYQINLSTPTNCKNLK